MVRIAAAALCASVCFALLADGEGKSTPSAAARIGGESIVLAKNEKGVLPLDAKTLKKVLVVGGDAAGEKGGEGGSAAAATNEVSFLDGLRARLGKDVEVTGRPFPKKADAKARYELKDLALAADATVVFAGAEPSSGENRAVAAILSWGAKNTVVVSRAAASAAAAWTDAAPTLLIGSGLGEEGGGALARVVLGDESPSGKLGGAWSAFPLGHGLSYTTFKYGPATVAKTADGFAVTIGVTNAGKVAGREVVQVYASHPGPSDARGAGDLKGFAKTKLLKPGETDIVTVSVPLRGLARFDAAAHRFATETGDCELRVGSSSGDIRATASVKIDARIEFDD